MPSASAKIMTWRDPDVIAYLTPATPETMETIQDWFPNLQSASGWAERHSRHISRACSSHGSAAKEDYGFPRLKLTYTMLRQLGRNFFQFGSGPDSDFRLWGVSADHCRLVLEPANPVDNVLLRDTSEDGTIVAFCGQGSESRHNFVWNLGAYIAWDCLITIEIDVYRFYLEVNPQRQSKRYDPVLRFPWILPRLPSTPPVYVTSQLLGSGSFGNVMLSWDASSGICVAIKTARRQDELQDIMDTAWTTERKVLSRLRKRKAALKASAREQLLNAAEQRQLFCMSFIVELIDICPTPQGTGLVLEYCYHGSLYELIQRDGALRHRQVATVLVQGLYALEYLHEAGIAHRDIKTENVLVRSLDPMVIALADLGSSSAKPQMTDAVTTRPYSAPEVLDAGAKGTEYTSKCDIWSLAAACLCASPFGWPQMFSDHLNDDAWFGLRGQSWCVRLVQHCHEASARWAVFEHIADCMLMLDPTWRGSARYCLDRYDQFYGTNFSGRAPHSAGASRGR